MPRKDLDLLVVGDANPDVVVSGAPERPAFGHEELVAGGELVLGGSGAITACGAARLGLRTAFVGRVGDDEAGRFVLDAHRRRGVDVSACVVDDEAPTALTVVLVHGSRHAMLTSRGALARVEAADVPASLLERTAHVHSSALFLHPRLQATLPDLFKAARAVGVTTSVDTNDDPSGAWTGLAPVLSETDLLLVNEDEARGLSGVAALEHAVKALADLGPTPVVKCGREGGLAFDGDSFVRASASSAEVVDTVGAGDTFKAGFLSATIRGLPLAESLAIAVRCGTVSWRPLATLAVAERPGGFGSQCSAAPGDPAATGRAFGRECRLRPPEAEAAERRGGGGFHRCRLKSTRAAGGTAAQPTWEEATA